MLQETYNLKTGPIIIHKLELIDICNYRMKNEIISNLIFTNNKERELFFKYRSHPSVHWRVGIVYGIHSFIFDLMTNLTNDKHYKNSFPAGGSSTFVCSPCFVTPSYNFNNIFDKMHFNHSYLESKVEAEKYKWELLKRLQNRESKLSIFYQEVHKNVINNYKIVLYK